MYEIPKVANVTANGEEIVRVIENGFGFSFEFYYNNEKIVAVDAGGKIYLIDDTNIDKMFCGETITDDIIDKYTTKEEREILIRYSVDGYNRCHIYHRDKHKYCSFL